MLHVCLRYTVTIHVQNILTKTGCPNCTEAAAYALRHEFVCLPLECPSIVIPRRHNSTSLDSHHSLRASPFNIYPYFLHCCLRIA